MSRIGKMPILLPEKVTFDLKDRTVKIKGPLGELTQDFRFQFVKVVKEGGKILVVLGDSEHRFARAEHGLVRALIANMVNGVVKGFRKDLEIVGVGFSGEVKGKALNLKIGFSHPVVFEPPAGIKIECPAPTKIAVSGADKQLVGLMAAKIRDLRPPEPYKGKGIKYAGEIIRRKAGKTGAK